MTQEPEYISVNRRAYDQLASEYRERAAVDRVKDVSIIAPFVDYLKKRFGTEARILDVGFGNGVNLAMFHSLGFNVAGIDISSEMLSVAKDLCPAADLRLGDFLTADYSPASFEGIFSKASIHLFPKEDAVRAIEKVAELLRENGMFYVTTTASSQPGEGYSTKDDYRHPAVRYRKSWTRDELLEAIMRAGLNVYAEGYNNEPDREKQWYNVWAVKGSMPARGGAW
jgi:SAM-dependent methyltransferase